VLFALFILRVAGQALVAFLDVRFLPPMERWYSGLIPYPYLLASQILIIALMARVCLDFTRGRGFFFEPIPIVFHWVLAAFVIAVGHSHRRRLKA
jgi:hypothetical protein